MYSVGMLRVCVRPSLSCMNIEHNVSYQRWATSRVTHFHRRLLPCLRHSHTWIPTSEFKFSSTFVHARAHSKTHALLHLLDYRSAIIYYYRMWMRLQPWPLSLSDFSCILAINRNLLWIIATIWSYFSDSIQPCGFLSLYDVILLSAAVDFQYKFDCCVAQSHVEANTHRLFIARNSPVKRRNNK